MYFRFLSSHSQLCAILTPKQVLTGSFVIRLVTLSNADVYPKGLYESIKVKAPNFAKWAEAVAAHPSVSEAFDEAAIVENTRERIAKMRAA